MGLFSLFNLSNGMTMDQGVEEAKQLKGLFCWMYVPGKSMQKAMCQEA